ncbi:MAG: hypothetical protein ACRDJV_14235 [Actinomycetota bacterium]
MSITFGGRTRLGVALVLLVLVTLSMQVTFGSPPSSADTAGRVQLKR